MNLDYKNAVEKINSLVSAIDPDIALKAAAIIVRDGIPVKIDLKRMKTLEEVSDNMDKVIELTCSASIPQKQCILWLDILESKRVALFDVLVKDQLEAAREANQTA